MHYMDADRSRPVKKSILPVAVLSVISAMLVAVGRSIPIGSVFMAGGVAFAYTDIFILVASGIGGLGGGLLSFAIIFIAEFFRLGGEYLSFYSGSTYLVLALVTPCLVYCGGFREEKGAVLSSVVLAVMIALCWKITFTVVAPELLDGILFTDLSLIKLFPPVRLGFKQLALALMSRGVFSSLCGLNCS